MTRARDREPARRGSARLSRTLENGRGDQRKKRTANNLTTQDDLSPDFFEQDSRGQICVRPGEGLKSTRSGLALDAGKGLAMNGNKVVIAKAAFVNELKVGATNVDRDNKMNELLAVLRGFILEEKR